MPRQLRGVMVAVLGVMLGSGFSPAILERLGEWTLSLSMLALYIAVSAAIAIVTPVLTPLPTISCVWVNS